MKISEDDIHLALKNVAPLPEEILKDLISKYEDNVDIFEQEINEKLIYNFENMLNKSLAQLCSTAKLSKSLRNYSLFWNKLESEIILRQDSLTNDQLCQILTGFSKATVNNIKIFEDLEEMITDSEVPFTVTNKF